MILSHRVLSVCDNLFWAIGEYLCPSTLGYFVGMDFEESFHFLVYKVGLKWQVHFDL